MLPKSFITIHAVVYAGHKQTYKQTSKQTEYFTMQNVCKVTGKQTE